MPRGKDKRLAYEARHGINKKEASRRRLKLWRAKEVRMKWQSAFWNKSQPRSVSHRWQTGFRLRQPVGDGPASARQDGAPRSTSGKEDTGESRQYIT